MSDRYIDIDVHGESFIIKVHDDENVYVRIVHTLDWDGLMEYVVDLPLDPDY